MKAISIWQPFSTLIVKGFKVFETRTWPAPKSVIGQRIGIASTKTLRPEQRAHFDSEEFQRHYERLGLPESIAEFSHGFMLGTVVVDSVELMTEEFLEEVSLEEQAYGWWDEGNYAWRLTDPIEFDKPIAVRGAQGIYEWKNDVQQEAGKADGSERPARLWRDLRTV